MSIIGGVLNNYFRRCSHFIPALFCSLTTNKLGEQAGIALGEALKVNTSLQNLE